MLRGIENGGIVGLEIMGAVVIGVVAAVLLIRRFGKKNR
jgi:hypothetical protein